MAGHNKWSKVKNRKGPVDAKRSKIWTKIIREITVASKLGGSDPSSNPRLRKALDDARSQNIPKDTIQRAQDRASSKDDNTNYEELTYEGYGPGGVAILIDCLTDNRNRTYGDVRSAVNKNGGNLGAPGSVSFGFKKRGQIVLDNKPALSEEQIMEAGLEYGLDDISNEDDAWVILCAPESLMSLKDAFDKAKFVSLSTQFIMQPDATVSLNTEQNDILEKLVDILEDLDDVQNVWTNNAADWN